MMSGLRMKYFVLKPEKKGPQDEYGEASRLAMLAYAEAIYTIDPWLADDLRKWVRRLKNEDEHRWKGKQPC